MNISEVKHNDFKKTIEDLGFKITLETKSSIHFDFNGRDVCIYPKSGWCTGKTIEDCRGLDKLLEQIQYD